MKKILFVVALLTLFLSGCNRIAPAKNVVYYQAHSTEMTEKLYWCSRNDTKHETQECINARCAESNGRWHTCDGAT